MNTNTTSSKSSVHFIIDFINKEIIGTQASFNKASKGSGAEYEELTTKMAAHSDFELKVKAEKNKSTRPKRSYEGMNTKFIKDYISTLDNAADMMAEYNAVQKMAKDCSTSAYPLTKKWFLGKFGTKEDGFDMEAAKEQISNFRISQAAQMAATLSAESVAEPNQTI